MNKNSILDLMMKDHCKIERLLNRLENGSETFNNLRWELENNSYDLRNRLMKHKNYEDRVFYPMMDRNLHESQKQRICERINKQINKQGAYK